MDTSHPLRPAIPTNPLSVLVHGMHEDLNGLDNIGPHTNFDNLTLAMKARLALRGKTSRVVNYSGAFRDEERDALYGERIKALEATFHALDPDEDNTEALKALQKLYTESTACSDVEASARAAVLDVGALLTTTRPHKIQENTSEASDITQDIYLWENGAVFVARHANGHTAFCVVYPDGDPAWEARLTKIGEVFPPPAERSVMAARAVARTVYVLVQTATGLTGHRLGSMGQRFVRENYTPDAIASFDLISTELRAQAPVGRLAIVEGPPGTGKSFFIRGLIDDVEGAIFLLIPADMVSMLGSPALIPVLLSIKEGSSLPIILVLEDAEQALAPRMGDNIAHVSSLLNFSDGLYGELLDIRVIATTNTPKAKFDEALLRDGRLITHAHIGPIYRDRAEAVFRRLLKDPSAELPEDVKTLAGVYKAARTKGWKNDARQNHYNDNRLPPGAGGVARLKASAGEVPMGFRGGPSLS